MPAYNPNLKTYLYMRGLGPDAVSVVGLTGWGLTVEFLLLRYSVVCTVESSSLSYLLFNLDIY